MTIPSNPIPPEDDNNGNMIDGGPVSPEPVEDENYVVPISNEISLTSRNVLPLEDPVGETVELPDSSEQAVVDSTYTDLDEPGEIEQTARGGQPPKPAYIAILTIIGLLILCCIMAGVMFLLLRNEIFATGV